MARYHINYTRTTYDERTNKVKSEKEVNVVVHADSARDALERYALRYKYECSHRVYDADTAGRDWAFADMYIREYGYAVWLFSAQAELIKEV